MSKHLPCSQRSESGVALLAVIAAVGFLTVLVVELGTVAGLDMNHAANSRDGMRAQFLARSALNLTELIIRLQQRIDNVKMMAGVQLTDYADILMRSFCGSPAEVKDTLGIVADESKGLGATIGTCGLDYLDTEDDKLNLNCANNTAAAQTLKTRLDALVFFPAYNPVFEEEDAEGWRRDREMQVTAILDYVDQGSVKFGSPGAAELYGYESLRDPYEPKNNYLDTVDELKLVRGVDDRFMALFGGAFTVYGGCKTNVSTMRDQNLIASTIYLAAKDPADPGVQDAQRLWILAGLVAQARQMGQPLNTLDDFASFVKDPAEYVGGLAEKAAALTGGQAPIIELPGVPPGMKVGVELDMQKLSQIAVAGPRRTYKAIAYGQIDNGPVDENGFSVLPATRRTVTGVWDTKVVNQNARNGAARNGTWVFLGESP